MAVYIYRYAILLRQPFIYAKETCRIETASYILQASGFDEIFVMNKQSEKLVRLGSMRLGWSPAIVPEACTYEMVKEDGCQAIRAHFTFPERDDSGRKIPETDRKSVV